MRVCGAADPVVFSLTYPALHCVPASWVFANCLRFARKLFVAYILMHLCLEVTEIRSYRAYSSFLQRNPNEIPVEENTKASACDERCPESLFNERLRCLDFSMSWWDCASTGDPDSAHRCVQGEHCHVEQSKNDHLRQLQLFPSASMCWHFVCACAQSTNYHNS